MSFSQPYCIALQPICDARMRHVADELLYRASANANAAIIDDQMMATARACNAAFYETGIESLCGSRKLFFNAPRDWLLQPELLPPNPEQVVIEVLESVDGDSEVLSALQGLKARGYALALDDFELTPATRPLLELADIIKLDMLNQTFKECDLDEYRARGITLLAEKVEDLATFESCKLQGFTLFQGYFYARPEVKRKTAVKREGHREAQLQILSELQHPEVDYDRIEQLLTHEPQLCVRLLRMINSAHCKRANTISSLRQAILLLGIDRLRTLVATLVLANDDPCNMLLLPQALTRAAMCLRLAAGEFNDDPDAAFMVGLLSMADLMLSESLETVCEQLPLSDAIKRALMLRTGNLGKVLKLVIAFEGAALGATTDRAVIRLNRYYLESCSWTSAALAGLYGT